MMRYSKPFLLSDTGSDRATAYNCSNKAITRDGRTHVVWTDAISWTRGRTYDHTTMQWGPTVTIGQGVDNHNNPTLTADSHGHLHISYGPHGLFQEYPDGFRHGQVKSGRSTLPNALEGLEEIASAYGYAATYSCLVHVPDGGAGYNAAVYRGGESPEGTIFQRTNAIGAWLPGQALTYQDITPGYTNVNAMIAVDARGTLYVASHYFSGERNDSLGVTVMKSDDHGLTWTDMTGVPASLPIRYSERFAAPAPPRETDPRLDGMVVDGRSQVWVLTSCFNPRQRQMLLSCWRDGRWETMDLSQFIPAHLSPMMACLSVDTANRIHVLTTTLNHTLLTHPNARTYGEDEQWWAHRSMEVAHIVSDRSGQRFQYRQISTPDDETPNWLPAISKPGPCHPVANPVLLYTHGHCGNRAEPTSRCRPTVRTEVYCVLAESPEDPDDC